ncbi:chemotaxis-specific protein-glutamate methyltransferase CheB [Sphingomonas sp. ASV193]|uniref:chemotaxis-specific protein-glutamate methyltransferase CheB n=1 Tax=Sphingomonas sp. ASV193 TaxID=3144405 RepID=UPI0032E86AC7
MARALATSPGRGAVRRPIRLMIVDDSMVARAVLSRMISADDSFEIAAIAATAEAAIEALGQVTVDVVLLDLEMPGAGGLVSIPAILKAARGAKVLIVSSLAEEGAEETVTALRLGATDTLPKPGTGRFNGRFSEVLLERLHALGHADRGAPLPVAAALPVSAIRGDLPPLRAMSEDQLELLAIGASTGGIHALGQLLAALPASIGVPILVTQHLPAPFMGVFARQLAIAANRPAVIAEDGMPLVPERIHIAPGDAHLAVELYRDRLVARLERHKVASGCLPSVDPMFASAGAVLGSGALGVVLTGMGRDGTEGAAKLVACGGAVIAQDEQSSAVWGMPRAVAEAGLVSAILPPDQIGALVGVRVAEAAPCK